MKKGNGNKKGNAPIAPIDPIDPIAPIDPLVRTVDIDSRKLKARLTIEEIGNSIRLVGYPHSWLEKFEDGFTLDQLKNLIVSTSIELDRVVHDVTAEMCVMYGAVDRLIKVIKERDEYGESASGIKARNTEKFVNSKMQKISEHMPGYAVSMLQTMYQIKTGKSTDELKETESLLNVFIVSLVKMNSLWIKEIEWNQKSNKD